MVDRERLLLCSDGLSSEVSDAVITAVLEQHAEATACAEALVAAANAAGGKDNVSVIVIDVRSGGVAAPVVLPAEGEVEVEVEVEDTVGNTLPVTR